MDKKYTDKLVKFWLETAEKDFLAAQSLFASRHYPQCLFFCHLSLEKLLKCIVVNETADHPPFIHDLRRLSEIASLGLSPRQKQTLDRISSFNISGRYLEIKFEFYKKYNRKDYVQKYLKITKGLSLWLKAKFLKK